MFKTIKSRIIIFTLVILLLLSLGSAFLLRWSYLRNRELITNSFDYKIANSAERLNTKIKQFEKNVVDMTIMGETFYYVSPNRQLSYLDTLVYENFLKDEISQGGGIFFEPYIVHPKQKLFCSYGFDNKNNVEIDHNSNTEAYMYPNKKWYLELKKEFLNGQKVAWSSPYIDYIGTKALMITVGAPLYNYNKKLLGIATSDWKLDNIADSIDNLGPTKNSFVIFADKKHNYIIAAKDGLNFSDSLVGEPLDSLEWYSKDLTNRDEFVYRNTKYIYFTKQLENNMVLIVNVPRNDFYADARTRLIVLVVMLTLSCLGLTGFVYLSLLYNVDKPISYLKKQAEEIGSGSLDTIIDIKHPQEFAELASTINKMTKDIKNYIFDIEKSKSEKKQMEMELNIAKTIQDSSLPSVFPPFPSRTEFDIYAFMETAKEVGGDFYDFFFIDETHLVFLIADVSGKGIPSALFMMSTKAIIEKISQTGCPIDVIIERLNKEVCKNNKQGFFVTMFCGILDTETGVVSFVNAGHNPPIIKTKEGTKYLETKSNIILGAFDDVTFEKEEIKLEKGDTFIIYTDGITEALNQNDEFYGDKRFLSLIKNIKYDQNIEDISLAIKDNVLSYTGERDRADDITYLGLRYNGDLNYKCLVLYPEMSNFDKLLTNFEALMKKNEIKNELIGKVNIVVEEFFTNIVKFAYPDKKGEVVAELRVRSGKIILNFSDDGIPYNPLEQEDVDIEAELEDRNIGGLGILMAKNMSDNIEYERVNDKNILTIQFNIV